MTLLIILAALGAILGAYAFMPAPGMRGIVPATLIVGGFLSLVWLVKLIILA